MFSSLHGQTLPLHNFSHRKDLTVRDARLEFTQHSAPCRLRCTPSRTLLISGARHALPHAWCAAQPPRAAAQNPRASHQEFHWSISPTCSQLSGPPCHKRRRGELHYSLGVPQAAPFYRDTSQIRRRCLPASGCMSAPLRPRAHLPEKRATRISRLKEPLPTCLSLAPG